ncbi:MAG: hypothetical protein ACTHOR_14825 [Devosia sp.]|jgi:hypothetical protein|nr:hypothetical protein [Devosiaceae bacterium]
MYDTWPWLVAVLGFIILGALIAYGMRRNRERTPVERAATEAGTRRLYEEEERRPGPD